MENAHYFCYNKTKLGSILKQNETRAGNEMNFYVEIYNHLNTL